MILFHLAGHSGAGKSRLTAALSDHGIKVPRAVLYTSRPPRLGEVHGLDYYFLSKGAIASLCTDNFFIGPVREMLQAVDLVQLEEDLRSKKNKMVLIEIFADLWPRLRTIITQRIQGDLHATSVFMTAVDPEIVKALPEEMIRRRYIRNEVERILVWRGKDKRDKVLSRARSAEDEILGALGLIKTKGTYDLVLHSSPEGPDGQDDWTHGVEPTGQAKYVLEQVVRRITAIVTTEESR